MSSPLIDLFRIVLEASWQSSLIILLILLLRPLMGSRIPALWRYLLWMLVLVRLLVPVSLFPPNPVSMQNIPAVDRPIEQVQLILPPAHEKAPTPALDYSAPDVSGQPPAPLLLSPISWLSVAAIVWLIGTLLMLGLMISAQILLWRRLARSGTPVDPEISTAWDNCRARLHIKTGPFLCMSPDIASPALVGWFFPVLLLPEKSFSSLSPEDWENIFVHELAHYQRADHWTHTLQLIALAIHWFNPFVWIGFRQLRMDRELAADEWSLQRLEPEQASAYGKTLLKVLTLSSQPFFSVAGVGILEDRAQLKQRLQRIVTFGQRPLLAKLAGLGVVLLLAALTLGYQWEHAEYKWLDPEQVLMRAIKIGDISTVRKQLDAGVDVNYEGGIDSDFPLYAAVIYNQPEIVKLLIARHADVSKKNSWGDVASFRAFWLGNKECADLLIQAGAPQDDLAYYAGTGDVKGLEQLNEKKPLTDADIRKGLNFAVASGNQNTFDWLLPRLAPMNQEQKQALFEWLYDMGSRGGHLDMIRHLESLDSSSPHFAHTALFFGVVWNRIELVKYLLSKPGAQWIPDPDDENATLLFAVQSPEMAEFLINHGVDVNTRNKDGATALIQICRDAWNSPETALVLLKHGANPNIGDKDGRTALLCARDGATVDELIHYGADIHAITHDGDGVLDYTSSGDVSRLEALIRHGVPFDLREGSDLLTRAAWRNQLDLINYLIKAGVDPNALGALSTYNGKPTTTTSPLDAAVSTGSNDAAKLLLDHGARPDDQLMMKALYEGHATIVKLFWEHGVRAISPLCYAISQGASIPELQKILDQGSPANPSKDAAISPLSEASRLGNLPAVQLLIERGANVNESPDLQGKFYQFKLYPLRAAAWEGQDDVVAYLLLHGARSDFPTMIGAVNRSAPYNDKAKKARFEKTVKVLIDANGLKDLSEQESAELLKQAVITSGTGNLTVLKMLLDGGLSLEAKDGRGQTVMEWARETSKRTNGSKPSKEMMTFLEEADLGNFL